jgi:hypothetical protein
MGSRGVSGPDGNHGEEVHLGSSLSDNADLNAGSLYARWRRRGADAPRGRLGARWGAALQRPRPMRTRREEGEQQLRGGATRRGNQWTMAVAGARSLTGLTFHGKGMTVVDWFDISRGP